MATETICKSITPQQLSNSTMLHYCFELRSEHQLTAEVSAKMKFITALLIACCLQKENGHTIAQTRKDIEEKLALLEGKNSYWHNFQKDDVVNQKTVKQKKEQSEALGFGKVFEQSDDEEDFRKDSKY